MKVQHYHSLSVTKSGNDARENEDAWRGVIPIDRDRPARATSAYKEVPARFAVADGATEAAFSGEWAHLLVNRFVDDEDRLEITDPADPMETSFARWMEPCREQWDRSMKLRNIPWHGQAKVRAGAMATFLGVQFWQVPKTRELRWNAVAVGDCCLFVVDGEGALRIPFPTGDPSDFGDMPSLVCSNPARAVREEQIRRDKGDCQKGDLYILATDAIACWALKQHKKGSNPWLDLEEICYGPDEKREAWVARHRTDRSMRNDDATVLTVRIV